MGTIGIAAGLATDNDMNILKFGAAGVTGGAMAGSTLASRSMNAPGNIGNWYDNRKQEVIKEAYKNNPKEYKKYLNQVADQQFLRDKEIRQKYKEAFGNENINQIMNNAITYRQHGITDDSVIIKAMKQNSPSLGDNLDSDKRIVAAKLASKIKSESDMEKTLKRLKEKNIPENVIREQERILRNMTDLY